MISKKAERLSLAAIIVFSLTMRVWFVFRYQGKWIDSDSAFFYISSVWVQRLGTIAPPQFLYHAGFGLEVFSTFASELTGLSLLTQFQYLLPLMGILPLLAMYVFFKRVLESPTLALVATLLLSLIPDFFFTTTRSTYEKFFYTILPLALFLFLLRTKTPARKPIETSGAFYLLIFGLITFNVFFSLTIIVMLAMVSAAMRLVFKRTDRATRLILQPTAISLIGVLQAAMIFYLYPPAVVVVEQAKNVVDLLTLFLTGAVPGEPTAAYKYVASTWPSPWIFLALDTLLWLTIAGALLTSYRAMKNMRNRDAKVVLLILFFLLGSAGGALSLLTDRLGLFTSNAEVRLVSLVLPFAAPLSVIAWRRITRIKAFTSRRVVAVSVIILLLAFAVAAEVKATNDPILSNARFYYTPDEATAIVWLSGHLPPGAAISSGLQRRAEFVSWLTLSPSVIGRVTFKDYDPALEYQLDSSIIRQQLAYSGIELSTDAAVSLIYTNGGTTVLSP